MRHTSVPNPLEFDPPLSPLPLLHKTLCPAQARPRRCGQGTQLHKSQVRHSITHRVPTAIMGTNVLRASDETGRTPAKFQTVATGRESSEFSDIRTGWRNRVSRTQLSRRQDTFVCQAPETHSSFPAKILFTTCVNKIHALNWRRKHGRKTATTEALPHKPRQRSQTDRTE